MDAAFVVAVAKRPEVDLANRLAFPGLVTTGTSSDLGFEARHRLDRRAPGLAFVGWHSEGARESGAWHEAQSGLTFLTGQLRWRGRTWSREQAFASAGWNDRARAYLERADATPDREPAPARTVPAPRDPRPAASVDGSPTATDTAPLMASIYSGAPEDRTALLRELFADASNPAWEVLDRSVALDALERFGALSNRQRKELFGAATAVAWLGSWR